MKKINLLFTVWGLSYGGAERFVLNLVKNLDKRKYNIVVFSDNMKNGPMQNDFAKYDAKIIHAKVHRFKHPFKYMKQLKDVISKEKIDIIHANDDLNMVFPLLAKPKNVKFVSHSHTTKFKLTKNRLLSLIASRTITRFISRHSDFRLSCGIDAGKAMYGNAKFEVLNNIMDVKKFKFSNAKRMSLRKKYKIKDSETVLLNVGRISKEKNQLFLVDVFAEYCKINKNLKLIIIGDGCDKKLLVNKIKKMHLTRKVILLSSQNDIAKFYNIADLFILPSLFEGLGMASIEAQANGLPCVFSNMVPSEADRSGRSCFISLKHSPKQWAKEISELNLSRSAITENMFESYNARDVINKIDLIYSKLANNISLKRRVKVSIIVPAYNVEKYIGRCLDSLISQTYTGIEIIIIDDGSTDRTRDVIRDRAKTDSRIILLEKPHQGPGMARKFGLEIASGNYIMFVDADDYLTQDAVAKIVVNFENNNVDVIRFNAIRSDNGEIILSILSKGEGEKIVERTEILKILLTSYKLNGLCMQAYKTSLFKKVDVFETELSYGEDFLANLTIHKETANNMLIISDSLYVYVFNPNSITRALTLERLKKNVSDRIFVSMRAIEIARKLKIFDSSMMQRIIFEQMVMVRDAIVGISKLRGYRKKDFVNDFSEIFEKNIISGVDVDKLDDYVKVQKIIPRLKYRKMLRAILESDYDTIWKYIITHKILRIMRLR